MLGGNGITLPYPQPVTPGLPPNFAVQGGSNVIALAAGNVYQVPAGWWYYDLGAFSALVFRDPVSGQTYPANYIPISSGLAATATARTGFVNSDGANWYIINPKALPAGATVTAAGSGYAQATTVVTPSTNSTDSVWHAIVGGSITSVTIGNDSKGNAGGSNFSFPPTLVIGAPPAQLTGLPSTATAMGGVQATATCTISGGAINAISVVAAGAGYSGAPTVQIIPNPFDPKLGSITFPALTAVVGGSGTVTAVVLDYAGTAGGVPTLTITGAGSSATATAAVGIATAATDTIILQQLGSWF